MLTLIRQTSTTIADANQRVEICKRAVNSAKQLADQAEKSFNDSVATHAEDNPKSGVAKKVEAVTESKAKLGNAQRLEKDAGEDHALAAGRADELDRRAKVLEELPRAKAALSQLQQVLKKHHLEDKPIWGGAETIVKSMPEKGEYDQLVKLAQQLSGHYASLQKNGATPAELGALYKDFPEKWRPPRFREDEKNWSAVSEMFSEESAAKRAKDAEDPSNTEIGKKIAEINSGLMTAAKGITDLIRPAA